MPSKSQTQKSKEKPTSNSPSSHHNPKSRSLPKMNLKPSSPSKHLHYLVVDTTLPFHVINDHSLFMMYMPGRKVHRTTLGHDIIIEGTGDVHIQVFVAVSKFLSACEIAGTFHPCHSISCLAPQSYLLDIKS